MRDDREKKRESEAMCVRGESETRDAGTDLFKERARHPLCQIARARMRERPGNLTL